jgi:hypothetical protein
MTENEIIEGNRLIAEFMGEKFVAYKENSSFSKKFKSYEACEKWIKRTKGAEGYVPAIGWNLKCGKYYESWDWIMSVVVKIEAFGLLVRIGGIDCEIVSKGVEDEDYPWLQNIPEEGFYSSEYERTKLSCVWDVVLQFIKWYNSQPVKPLQNYEI